MATILLLNLLLILAGPFLVVGTLAVIARAGMGEPVLRLPRLRMPRLPVSVSWQVAT